jgi:hypothetical protein
MAVEDDGINIIPTLIDVVNESGRRLDGSRGVLQRAEEDQSREGSTLLRPNGAKG